MQIFNNMFPRLYVLREGGVEESKLILTVVEEPWSLVKLAREDMGVVTDVDVAACSSGHPCSSPSALP